MMRFHLLFVIVFTFLPPVVPIPTGFIPKPPKDFDPLLPIPFLFGGCKPGCHCHSKAHQSIYFADPAHGVTNTSRLWNETGGTIIAIVTPWFLHYDAVVKKKVEEQGLKSVPDLKDEQEICGWFNVANVSNKAVERGTIECGRNRET